MNGRDKDLEIEILHRISRAVLHEHNIPLLLKDVLDVMHREIGFLRGTFTLLRDDDVLYIEASHGLTEDEIKRGKYHLGEGITGRVGETGQPILIPDITKDPNFLNRTRTRNQVKNVAFLCVPIIHMEKVIGTLSMDRQIVRGTDLQRDMQLLETVANIMADAVDLCRQGHKERERLITENQRLREELDGRIFRPSDLIGNCGGMRAVYARIEQVAGTDATVLIRGSAGTGKEQAARSILDKSRRKDMPFLVVACGSMRENQTEREIFGSESADPAGSDRRIVHQGKLEAADGGTLYLDEIGALPPSAQVRLLRFLQSRTFVRVGGVSEHRSDVRILASTSRDLEALMDEGKFREDLYYRLNVFPISLPDLRNRRSDIILLAEHFLEKYSMLYKKDVRGISATAISAMMTYHWPGNVRELENCMERAVLSATGDSVAGYDLPPSLQACAEAGPGRTSAAPEGKADFTTLVHSFERELIEDALRTSRGNVSAAARALNLTDRVIHYKIQKLHITPEWYRITGG